MNLACNFCKNQYGFLLLPFSHKIFAAKIYSYIYLFAFSNYKKWVIIFMPFPAHSQISEIRPEVSFTDSVFTKKTIFFNQPKAAINKIFQEYWIHIYARILKYRLFQNMCLQVVQYGITTLMTI